MPRKLEDVLRSRRLQNEAIIRLNLFRDELDASRALLRVLANACTAHDFPQEVYANASLADLIDDRLRNVEQGLSKVQKLLRRTP